MSLKSESIAHIELELADIQTALSVLELQSQMSNVNNANKVNKTSTRNEQIKTQARINELRQRSHRMANTLMIAKNTNDNAWHDLVIGDSRVGDVFGRHF